jgi:hypothetical protein
MNWGSSDPAVRGTIDHCEMLLVRMASYSIYRTLAVSLRQLDPAHRPDLFNTEPVVVVGPHASRNDPWKIVSMDPFGADVARLYQKELKSGLDVRPTIAITGAHMRLAEIEEEV